MYMCGECLVKNVLVCVVVESVIECAHEDVSAWLRVWQVMGVGK